MHGACESVRKPLPTPGCWLEMPVPVADSATAEQSQAVHLLHDATDRGADVPVGVSEVDALHSASGHDKQ